MASGKRNALIGILATLIFVGAADVGYRIFFRLTPPTPPLLSGATASGGWFSEGCPPQRAFERLSDEAKSPEVEERLRKLFPAGTSGAALAQSVTSQGFTLTGNCPNDASIKRAIFSQHGGGPLSYRAFAVVAWKVDVQDKIVWTKGMLFYDGL